MNVNATRITVDELSALFIDPPCERRHSRDTRSAPCPELATGSPARIFVDKRYRTHGYAKVALAGALHLIAAQGGGVVEGYPHEIGEKRMNNSFVYNGTRTMYEQAGFEFVRSKGMKNTVLRRTVIPF